MLKKEEVFVRVSSKKKARKLKELLDMFGESIWDRTNERLEKGIVSDEYPFIHYGDIYWSGLSVGDTVKEKTQVSLKELRNILSVEHLKEGDIVVFECFYKSIAEISRVEGCKVYVKNEIFVESGRRYTDGHETIDNFIRYATEEEKELLNPKQEKKELEVGKWYIVDKGDCINKYSFDAIIFYKGKDYGYGLNHIGEWTDEYNTNNHYFFKDVKREATPQEVEQSLIKEAKRRGYKDGVYIEGISSGVIFELKGGFEYLSDYNILWYGTYSEGWDIFKKGKWAEVI